MSRIAYVNGRYLPFRDAKVHVEDRGYQFADGVYEVCEVRGGRLIDERRHLDRLERSLGALRIRMPMSRAALGVVLREVVARNRIGYGTRLSANQPRRGAARSRFSVAGRRAEPGRHRARRSIRRATKRLPPKASPSSACRTIAGAASTSRPVGLLPNVLARQAAIDQGAREAWFVDKDGMVTEGASANAWIVTQDGKLVTRQADHAILRGITRAVVLDVDQGAGAQPSRSAPSRWRRPMRRARPSSPRRPRS